MVPFDEAVRKMLDAIDRRVPARVPLADAVGLVLAENVVSDVDMPPFNKSAMDGFAVAAADLAVAPCTLPVLFDVPAGALPPGPLQPGYCARMMTGAPVPEGADAVVRIEDTQPSPDGRSVAFPKPIASGANVCLKAEDVRMGDVVLEAGHLVRPLEVPTLAACGYTLVPVYRRPSVAVLSTGNEVVATDHVPQAGQIRDANAPYLAARLRRLGIEILRLGIAPDEPSGLKAALAEGLKSDALVVSGGVSMGDFDLVPGLLRELGTDICFDSVAMQPGRPTVFGLRGRTAIFGLPGNPVSVLVACELFLVPALRRMMGYSDVLPRRRKAILVETASHRAGRVAHLPGVLAEGEDGLTVRPLPYHGSAHIHALSRANCLFVLPPDVATLEAPAAVEVVELTM